jgi:hypothetical protein
VLGCKNDEVAGPAGCVSCESRMPGSVSGCDCTLIVLTVHTAPRISWRYRDLHLTRRRDMISKLQNSCPDKACMDLFKLHNYCAACLWFAGYLVTGQCLPPGKA